MLLTTSNILFALLFLAIAIVGLIFALKWHFAQQSNRLISKYKNQENQAFANAYFNKYPEANIFKYKNTFYQVGLIFTVSLAILVMNWTTFENIQITEKITGLTFDEIEMHTPRTFYKPTPPPLPTTVIIPDELIEDTIEFLHFETEEELIETSLSSGQTTASSAFWQVAEGLKEEEIFTVVEDMPCFPGCEDLPTNDERKKCTETNLLKFIYKNAKYPAIARENGVEGLCVVTFVLAKDGSIKNIKCLKDIGAGFCEELVRVVHSMNDMPQKWQPGRQRGEPVNVRYNFPMRIHLRGNFR